MEYTYPDYFYDFKCTASECKDTCCAVWKIVIDEVSLEEYRKFPGFFGNRLKNSIDWKEGTFEQYDGRCAFLSDDNLCDIYTEGGPQMLCKTCMRYPRHYEEFENLREVSLSLSCPEAARLILSNEKKVTFLSSSRKTPEEEYEEFDFFLFTKLLQIRDYLYQVAQNRELSIDLRMALILTTMHDMQSRITKEKLYAIDELLERYQSEEFLKSARKKLEKWTPGQSGREQRRSMWKRLYRLEYLKTEWPKLLRRLERRLYEDMTADAYEEARAEFAAYYRGKEYEYEQLLVYFIFTYFCGAVYDGDALGKVKLALVSTMLIREMDFALWLEKGKQFTLEDQIEIAHSYSREIEHSDLNMAAMEAILADEQPFTMESLLDGILK